MSQTVLVIAEQNEGRFRKVTYEALSAGRKIAESTGGPLCALVLGNGIETVAAELAQYGAVRTLVADDAALADYATETYTQVVADLTGSLKPSVIVLGATSQGKDLAARLSARLNAALATDCIALEYQNQQVVARRAMYGGKVLADVVLTGEPVIAAVRPNTMAASLKPAAGGLEKIAVSVAAPKARVVGKQLDSGKVELTEADVIVSGGRGMGGADYSVIEALAGVLGGAVGASRSAVDEGWRSAADQVGQTGKTVSPTLYIACGISGAIQHLAGMSSSKVIVAINKDPEAPIFSKADYGIVANLFEALPLMTEAIKKVKG